MFARTEVRVLHQVQLIDGIDVPALAGRLIVVAAAAHDSAVAGRVIVIVTVVVMAAGMMAAMEVHVLQGERIGGGLVQLIESAAVHRDVRAAEAVVRVGRIVCRKFRDAKYILL